MSEVDLLSQVPIFSNVDSSVLERLHSRMTKRSYEKNEIILMEDDFGDTFFIIVGGRVKITRISSDGKEVILAILGDGQFFGEMSLFDDKPRSANAAALEESSVLILRRNDFLPVIENTPEIVVSIMAEMARRIRKSDEQIKALSLSDAEHRIGMTLFRLADEQGTLERGEVLIKDLPLQQDIANMAGTSRSTASRMMKRLDERMLIRKQGRQVWIPDYTLFSRIFGRARRKSGIFREGLR
ncbi:MAG: Crp/Fnr family transcriptional regulator [Fidelibacterota bacterium]